MPTTVLVIGDPHIQVANIPQIDIFIERLIKLAISKEPDLIVIAGDLLHTHERLHTLALNKACELVDKMRKISLTYVLVGNHDYIQNQQFLTHNHWMNGLKEWNNTVIVDKVIRTTIKNEKFIFVPYVPPGRFQEALDTLGERWDDASCIFAHQEFFGCKMGAIISVEGDKWELTNPHVVSGHIHSRQIPQPNIYYPGSALQHAFGESEKNIIAYLQFSNQEYTREEIDLKLSRKKIVYIDVEKLEDYIVQDSNDKIKLSVTGNYDQFKALRKTKKYKQLIKSGIKVVFKPKKYGEEKLTLLNGNSNTINFNHILYSLILKEKDPYLLQVYESVIKNKDINVEDVMFL